MCGICGIVLKKSNSSSIEAPQICQIMGESITHRGPDARGFWSRPDHGIFFEHRRLAIIDLSPAGEQPFFNEKKTLTCLVNGEIYNYRELRSELTKSSHEFRSECDVEVVPHLFEEKGIEGWKQLRGMYAIAMYDTATRKLYLKRDPLGIKPLYLYEDGNLIAFSSEIRAFQKIPGFKKELDWDALTEFLMVGSISAPKTYLKNVRTMEPGEVLMIHDGKLSSIQKPPVTELWDSHSSTLSPNDAVQNIKYCLRDSVEKHLISDVPIGIFLSGGIDSGTLAGIASEISNTPVHTVSVTIPGDELDESSYARATAKKYGTAHSEVPLEQKSFEADFEKFFNHLDQPSIDGFNTYIVSKAARQAGLTVALSGVGGDEIFGGYNSFEVVPKLKRIHNLLNMAGSLGRRGGANLIKLIRKGSAGTRVADYLGEEVFDTRHSYFATRGLFSAPSLTNLFKDSLANNIPHAFDRLIENTRWAIDGCIHEQVAIGGLELTRYMRYQLLRDTDVMSMAHSIEVRTPLVDKEVIRTCLPYLGNGFNTDGHPKWLLRQALSSPLPNEVVARPKQGFVFPWQKWLRGFVLKDFDQVLADSNHPIFDYLQREKLQWWRDAYVRGWAHWSCFWALYVLMRFVENSMSSRESEATRDLGN